MNHLVLIKNQLQPMIDAYTQQKNIQLYFSYYYDTNPQRNQEIELCLRLNTKNQLFSKIFILNESKQKIPFLTPSERIKIVDSQRLTFNGFFKFANQQTSDAETINILINTDIIIGQQFDQLKLNDHQVICLSRHDLTMDGKTKVNVRGGSHDCWIWRGQMKDNIGQFYMGKFLCDGVLANELHKNGYQLKNPMIDLKIYHLHLTNVRNYCWHDKVLGQRRGVKFSKNDHIFSPGDVYDDGYNA